MLIFVPSSNGGSPLHFASKKRNSHNMVKMLLLQGADINSVRTVDGNTALHIAVSNKRTSVVRTLLAYGADTTLKNCDGKTPRDLCDFSMNSCFMSYPRRVWDLELLKVSR